MLVPGAFFVGQKATLDKIKEKVLQLHSKETTYHSTEYLCYKISASGSFEFPIK